MKFYGVLTCVLPEGRGLLDGHPCDEDAAGSHAGRDGGQRGVCQAREAVALRCEASPGRAQAVRVRTDEGDVSPGLMTALTLSLLGDITCIISHVKTKSYITHHLAWI